jgi:hypothetical protein
VQAQSHSLLPVLSPLGYDCCAPSQVLGRVEGVPAPVVVRDRGQVYNSDGTARVVVAPGGTAASAIAASVGCVMADLGPLLSPTCRHDNIIGLLGVVLDHQQQAQMLVLELAQVRVLRQPVKVSQLAGGSAVWSPAGVHVAHMPPPHAISVHSYVTHVM